MQFVSLYSLVLTWRGRDMSIELSPHARKRLMIRRIDEKDVIITLKNPDKVLFDEETGNFIAVRKINDKILVVAYTIAEGAAKVVSAFLSSKIDIDEKRVRNGRWREI